jgi:hypothetical protein
MPNPATATLRMVNRNLRAGLARLSSAPNTSVGLNPQDLSGLQAELLRAGECLRNIPCGASQDVELETAVSEYRSNVEHLAQTLPEVQGRLLTEKARLELTQMHVTATKAWAQASQKTL